MSAPRCQVLHLLPVCSFIVVGYEANNGCVIYEFHYSVGTVSGGAVAGEQGVEDWTEDTALRNANAEGNIGEGVMAQSHPEVYFL